MKVDLYASEPQYLAHLTPIWEALQAHERGTAWLARRVQGYAPRLALPGASVRVGSPQRARRLTLAASWQDERRCRPRPVAYVEHGAGQTYTGSLEADRHPSYSGGTGHELAACFLCPSETVAERWRLTYPEKPAYIVGVPKLDRWHNQVAAGLGVGAATRKGAEAVGSVTSEPDGGTTPGDSPVAPIVAISFHADIGLCPETRNAFSHYQPALPLLAARFRMLGHAHPRFWESARDEYERVGIEPVQDFDEVLNRASLYMVDNSSTGLEFASTGRPIVWLDAPWYRRDVEHGGRFWTWASAGLRASQPDELPSLVERALDDPPEVQAIREATIAAVYAFRDGGASQRACWALRETVARLGLEDEEEWAASTESTR